MATQLRSGPSFSQYVESLQRNCSLPVIQIYTHLSGWGSVLNYGMLVAVWAWITGHRITWLSRGSRDNSEYFDGFYCLAEGHTSTLPCYFRPMMPCNLTAASDRSGKSKASPARGVHRQWKREDDQRGEIDLPLLRRVAEEQTTFRENAVNPWFWSAVFATMFQPNDMFEQRIQSHEDVYRKQVEVALGQGPEEGNRSNVTVTGHVINGSSRNSSHIDNGSDYVCVHMRGVEKGNEVPVHEVDDYARLALRETSRLSQRGAPQPHILLISEDPDRATAFERTAKAAAVSVVSLSPTRRSDEHKYLHVVQMMASMRRCARAAVVIATVSSNIGRVILYMHLQHYPETQGSSSRFISLDQANGSTFPHLKDNIKSGVSISLDRGPFWPT